MEILYLLIPLSVVLVFVIAVLFWWAVEAGQFDDLEGPAYRMLLDDEGVIPEDHAAVRATNPGLLDPGQGRSRGESRY